MKSTFCFPILFLCFVHFCKAQNSTVVIDTSMFNMTYQAISLTGLNGWIFKEGNDPNWANDSIDTKGWIKFNPSALTVKNADKNGRVEGWFRLKFRLDSSFRNFPIRIGSGRFAAADLYIDGQHIASFGNTGLNGKPYKEFRGGLDPPVKLNLQTNVDHTLAFHLVDYRSPLNPYHLKTQDNGNPRAYAHLMGLAGDKRQSNVINLMMDLEVYLTFWASICGILSMLFWLLYFKNRNEKNLIVIALATTLLSAVAFFAKMEQTPSMPYIVYGIYYYTQNFLTGLAFAVIIITLAKIFKRKITTPLVLYCAFISVAFIADLYFFESKFDPLLGASTVFVCIYLIIASWRKLKGAQWSVVAGILLTLVFAFLYEYNAAKFKRFPFPFVYLYLSGMFLSFPLSLMVYVASRFKEILNDVRSNANAVVKITEEKKELLAHQNEMLEKQVEERTGELKASQSQLIQSEKMASLGELTAGIAHEIQNPLNFVNNFSEVNKEMLEELKAERLKPKADRDEHVEDEIINDLIGNSEKINLHGKRAGDIVKGMLQHSRSSAGVKEPTDINALADEYLRLSYHGLRAKDKSFNATMKTDFDASIGKINIIPQDIGRVLLNLFNNAFYATSERQKAEGLTQESSTYNPTVCVRTRRISPHGLASDEAGTTEGNARGGTEISVKDNGNGIPKKALGKIFQPFFTTKPTGHGTGLGLSLSYDIVKAHGGELKVKTKEGSGSEFTIWLQHSAQ